MVSRQVDALGAAVARATGRANARAWTLKGCLGAVEADPGPASIAAVQAILAHLGRSLSPEPPGPALPTPAART